MQYLADVGRVVTMRAQRTAACNRKAWRRADAEDRPRSVSDR